ncbi:MAG: hypothetical protein JSS49_30650 [Planctomycetes bacterium]|nr:hypothetical protein [Planctomycetota bacterium]
MTSIGIQRSTYLPDRPTAWLLILAILTSAVPGCGDPPTKVVLNKKDLNDVRDGTLAIENSGYANVLKHAALVRNADLEKAGRKVAYDDLIDKPAQFRGEPILVEGLLWRLFKLPAAADDSIRVDYEAWIVTDDSRPYRVVFSELPDGLKPGDQLRSVRAAGYFFVLEGHSKDDQGISVPVLLARNVVPLGNGKTKPGSPIRYAKCPLPKQENVLLPDIPVRLQSDDDGNLIQLTIVNRELGNDDAAFEQLNNQILKIIGRPGNPITEDIRVKMDVDFECHYSFVQKAVSNCMGRVDDKSGRMTRYIEHIDFTPPGNPKVFDRQPSR